MRIVPFESRYRDDMIFVVLQGKDALGRIPRLNEDLLDVPGNYLAVGDCFWLAVDDADRVVGCVGYRSVPGTDEVWLHRFYVKASLKRRGIGTALYRAAEGHILRQGKAAIRVHLGGEGYEASHRFYQKQGFEYEDEDHMRKTLR